MLSWERTHPGLRDVDATPTPEIQDATVGLERDTSAAPTATGGAAPRG